MILPCKGKTHGEKLAVILMRAFSTKTGWKNREASGLRRLQRRFRADEGDEKTDDFRACQKRCSRHRSPDASRDLVVVAERRLCKQLCSSQPARAQLRQ